MYCTTCGNAAPAGASFCEGRCAASYKRALAKHPLRVGDRVHVPAEAYATVVCSLCPALVHASCTDIDQVRTASGHYLLPQAVADPITAWVEHIGNGIRLLPGETPAQYERRAALGISHLPGESDDNLRRRVAYGVTNSTWLGLLAQQARESSREQLATLEPSTAAPQQPGPLYGMRKRTAQTALQEAALPTEKRRPTDQPPGEAELWAQLMGPLLPDEMWAQMLANYDAPQLAAVARQGSRFAAVIDRTGLLLRYGHPEYMVKRAVRAAVEQDAAVFSVCMRYMTDTLAPLFFSMISALHKGCTQGYYDVPDFVVYEWVRAAMDSLSDTQRFVDAELQRITTHQKYTSASMPEVPVAISYGIDDTYIDGAARADAFYFIKKTSAALETIERTPLPDATLLSLARKAVFRRRCLRVLQWLYLDAAGMHLSLDDTCLYTMKNVLTETTAVTGAVIDATALRYFLPAEASSTLALWRVIARQTGTSMRSRGLYILNAAYSTMVQNYTTPCAIPIVQMLCDEGCVRALCQAVVTNIYVPLFVKVWLDAVFEWINAQNDRVQILRELSTISLVDFRTVSLNTVSVISLSLLTAYVRSELTSAAADLPSTKLDRQAEAALLALASFKQNLSASYGNSSTVTFYAPLATVSRLLESSAQELCNPATPHSSCVDALQAALFYVRASSTERGGGGSEGPTVLNANAQAFAAALRVLMRRLSPAELAREFSSGLAHPFHIVQILAVGDTVRLPRRAALKMACHMVDQYPGADRIFLPPPHTASVAVPELFGAVGDNIVAIVYGAQLYSMRYGGEDTAAAMFAALSVIDAQAPTTTIRLEALRSFAQGAISTATSQQLVSDDFNYECALFTKRLLTLDMLAFMHAGAAAMPKPLYTFEFLQAHTGVRRLRMVQLPGHLLSLWVDLVSYETAFTTAVGHFITALDTAMRNTRLRARSEGAYKAQIAAAQRDVAQHTPRQMRIFFNRASARLVRFLARQPQPAYYREESLYGKPPPTEVLPSKEAPTGILSLEGFGFLGSPTAQEAATAAEESRLRATEAAALAAAPTRATSLSTTPTTLTSAATPSSTTTADIRMGEVD
jgi:hypothetical protein